MFMDDPEKRVLLGLPAQTRKIINPFYEATQIEAEGNRKEAERIYIELLNCDFENPVLLAALGMNYAVAEKNGLAYNLLSKAYHNLEGMVPGFQRLGITPKGGKEEGIKEFMKIKRSEILNAMGTCHKHENRTKEAREFFNRAQDGLPTNPDIQNNLGTLYINEGKPEEAQRHLFAALEVDPNHAQAHWNLSLSHLELGNYAQGWAEYDWGITAKVRMERNYSNMPLPFWDGTPGKRIILYGEQGIGDEILFASVLPDLLRDCPDTVFECHRKLHTLFATSFDGIDIYPTREDEVLTWPIKSGKTPRYNFDYKLPIGGLPKFYRNKLEDFPGTPFLKPSALSEETWAKRLAELGPKPKVGISWVGGHKKTRIEVRSIELEKLLPILGHDVDWISLQYTPCEPEIAELEKKHGIKIHHWPEAVYSANYDDTAGLVANLDLVITVATSVVHLAGGMGVPCWVLTASRAAWREFYCPNEGMPWYNSVHIFKQETGSIDWQPVIDRVAASLSSLMESNNDQATQGVQQTGTAEGGRGGSVLSTPDENS